MENKKVEKCIQKISNILYDAIEEQLKVTKENGVFKRDQIKLCTVNLTPETLEGYDDSLKDEIIDFFIQKTKHRKEFFIGNYEISLSYENEEKDNITFYGYYKTLIRIKGTLISNRYFFDIYGAPEVSMGANISKIWKYHKLNNYDNEENLLLAKIPATDLDYLLDNLIIRSNGQDLSFVPKDAQVEFDKEYSWYGIDGCNDTFVNISKTRIKSIYKHVSLINYFVNDNRHENWFGLCLNVWRNPILYFENWDYMGVDTDSYDLKVLEFILNNTPDDIKNSSDSTISHRLYNLIKIFVETKNIPSEKIIENIKKLNEKVSEIQKAINQSKEEIVNKLYEDFFPNDCTFYSYSLEQKIEKLSSWDSHSLDCGFTSYFIDSQKDAFQNAYMSCDILPKEEVEKLYGGQNICSFAKDGHIVLNTPVFNQSIHLQAKEANLICEIVKEKLNISLSVKQKLD